MNTEAARNVVNNLSRAGETIEGELNNLRGQVGNLVGSEWQGQSANQFQEEFQRLDQSIQSILGSLDNLQTQLNYEISAWENVAGGFRG
jgi:WXG100 family type VII secretion target